MSEPVDVGLDIGGSGPGGKPIPWKMLALGAGALVGVAVLISRKSGSDSSGDQTASGVGSDAQTLGLLSTLSYQISKGNGGAETGGTTPPVVVDPPDEPGDPEDPDAPGTSYEAAMAYHNNLVSEIASSGRANNSLGLPPEYYGH